MAVVKKKTLKCSTLFLNNISSETWGKQTMTSKKAFERKIRVQMDNAMKTYLLMKRKRSEKDEVEHAAQRIG